MFKYMFFIALCSLFASCDKEQVYFQMVDDSFLIKPSRDWSSDIDALRNKSQNLDKDSLILFVGSSTFTFWANIESYFPNYKIVNNGFGGSHLIDLIYYYDDLIKKINPSIIVLYYGDNDIASYKTNILLLQQQVYLFNMLEKYNSNARIVLLSVKYSPLRIAFQSQQQLFNEMNSFFVRNIPNAVFYDFNYILFKDNSFLLNNYKEDLLHINENTYKMIADSLNIIFSKIYK